MKYKLLNGLLTKKETDMNTQTDENKTTFQVTFVESLVESIRREVTRNILQGKIPETWDGIELRQYLADKFNDSTFPDILKGARKREYHNTIIVSNI